MCILYHCIICFCFHEFLEEGRLFCGLLRRGSGVLFVWGGFFFFLYITVTATNQVEHSTHVTDCHQPENSIQLSKLIMVPDACFLSDTVIFSSATISNIHHIKSVSTWPEEALSKGNHLHTWPSWQTFLSWPETGLEKMAWSYVTGGLRLGVRKRFFTQRVAEHWNRLPRKQSHYQACPSSRRCLAHC